MTGIDVSAIVPSTRDLLQALATRRATLGLVAVVQEGAGSPDAEARRLDEAGVRALAFDAPGPPMRLAAAATRSLPCLSLRPVTSRDDGLEARSYGADGACIAAIEAWAELAATVRATRMSPLALAADAAARDAALHAGAKALVLRASSWDEAIALAAPVPRSIVTVAWLADPSLDALRALAGHVDAAVVPAAVHAAPRFADVVAELDG